MYSSHHCVIWEDPSAELWLSLTAVFLTREADHRLEVSSNVFRIDNTVIEDECSIVLYPNN